VREQHHHVHLATAAEGFHRRPAGVAGGRHHDGGALAPRLEHVVHQPRHQLHGEVLERERRAVEQLQHEQAGAELGERRHRRMAEGAIGLARHAGEIGLGQTAADKGTDHLDRDFGVWLAGKARNGGGIERRPGFGHVKAAVAGEPGQHNLDEIEGRGLAPS
jgi:hypothetical protein